jgi:hypothetical protein
MVQLIASLNKETSRTTMISRCSLSKNQYVCATEDHLHPILSVTQPYRGAQHVIQVQK